MSVLYNSELGYLISHEKYIRKIYGKVNTNNENHKSYEFVHNIFNIKYPYVKPKLKQRKRKTEEAVNETLKSEVEYVRNLYKLFRNEIVNLQLFETHDVQKSSIEIKNIEALITAECIYKSSGTHDVENIIGHNTENARYIQLETSEYIFPENCRFFCSNTTNIKKHLGDEKFNLILLDPPWWNKYIRRKKLKTNNSYHMMYNDDLKKIPIETLIQDDGIVIVWCTNAVSHVNYLKNNIFKKWNLRYLATWYWMKVTKTGEPICNFSDPPGKQPFEQIIFASRHKENYSNLPDRKIIVSVPSALHSHKPPLQDVLKKFIPKDAKCLEVFARYLLPNWTSYGLEAIRFQHHSLYKERTSETA